MFNYQVWRNSGVVFCGIQVFVYLHARFTHRVMHSSPKTCDGGCICGRMRKMHACANANLSVYTRKMRHCVLGRLNLHPYPLKWQMVAHRTPCIGHEFYIPSLENANVTEIRTKFSERQQLHPACRFARGISVFIFLPNYTLQISIRKQHVAIR